MLVGYKLIDTKDGSVLQSWGGYYGSSPDAPNSVFLPNGDSVCGVTLGEVYGGRCQLVEWFMDEPAPPPLTKEDVNAERDLRISAGLIFQGKPFQSRPEDRENVAGATTWASLALMGGAKPGDYRWHGGEEDFAWIAADNSLVKMDAPTVIEFGKALGAWKSAHIFAARMLKDLPEIPADYRDAKYWPVQKLEEVQQ
jgi:hypothetical protein